MVVVVEVLKLLGQILLLATGLNHKIMVVMGEDLV
jgi:hypothetical protein|tara:strand:+ start:643 stop:747 length:105 start_codon:yes stop_codon:yes gene_type:complete